MDAFLRSMPEKGNEKKEGGRGELDALRSERRTKEEERGNEPNVSSPRTVVTYFRLFRSIRLMVICARGGEGGIDQLGRNGGGRGSRGD